MFAGLTLTAAFTAHLAAALTANFIRSPVTTPSDLAHLRVGYVQDAASLEPLRSYGARPIGYPDAHSGLVALARGEIEAFVHDEPILIWELSSVPGVITTPVRFAPQFYAIVLPEDVPMREAVDRALLEVLASGRWTAIQQRYLGTHN
jgi:ABC-type amino acid transport substrate-binding protein